MGKSQRSVRNWLVEPFRQLRVGLYFLAMLVAFTLLAGWLFVDAYRQQYEHVMSVFNQVDPSLKWDLVVDETFQRNVWRMTGILGACLLAMFVVIVRITHRYYGPLVAIQRFVGAVKSGDYAKRCTLRDGDELQELATSLNEMAKALEERHGAAKVKAG